MGAKSFEVRLRNRLLAVLAPVCIALALAAVLITKRALDAADTEAARNTADVTLHTLRAELDEGDQLETAVREVIDSAQNGGKRIELQATLLGKVWQSTEQLPVSLRGLSPGACSSGTDARTGLWQACAVRLGAWQTVVAVPVQAHRAVLHQLMISLLGVVALLLAGAVGAGRLALRAPLRQLEALVSWTERVVASDNSRQAPRSSILELERLTIAFESLVERLVQALARERAISAHIAHELRTPLTAIRGELDALPSEGKDAVSRMREDVSRLADVIDAILVLSAPPAARKAETIVNLADLVRELAPAETVVLAPDEALIEGDPRLAELALKNLLENAQKHGGRPAQTVRVSREGNTVQVAVSDEGPGLDARQLSQMFDRYWRATSDGNGSGLGLALVRAVAEHHGGHASARLNASGRGLEVSMTFGQLVDWHG